VVRERFSERWLSPVRTIRGDAVKPILDAAGAAGAIPIGEGQPLPPHDRADPIRRSSLDMLFRTEAPKLLRRFARRADRNDAQDLVQDCFVRLARMPAEAREEIATPEAHLNAVSQNVLRNRARAAFHRSVVVQDCEAADRVSIDITANLEARDMLKRLDAAMVKLDPKTREIFMALRLDGVTYAEMAERMGLSVKGVEWHMSKALAVLHRAAGHR
jgi:RNA polymerase sigma factor (sigma-70 family)